MHNRSAFGRRRTIASAAAFLAAPSIAHAQGKSRVALVIGNSNYSWESSLPNVRRDVADVARRFQSLGLATELVQDLGHAAMREKVEGFLKSSAGADFAAIYFGGHGVQVGQRVYLVPVDADLNDPASLSKLVHLRDIRLGMAKARHGLVVLDSCRNSPADGWRQVEAERSAVVMANQAGDNPPNLLLLFSTAPGRVALDGPPGDNSPFAVALLQQLASGSVDLREIAPRLRRDLLIATQGRQVLWDVSTYNEGFQLSGTPEAAPKRGTGRPAADPSRVVELTNAFAFARENSLVLPPGLVAYRPPGGRDSQRIGSFKCRTSNKFGSHPAVFVVLATEDDGRVQLLFAGRDGAGRANWQFITALTAGNRMTYAPSNHVTTEFLYDWKDANGGSLTLRGYDGFPMFTTPFTRLD